MLTAHQAIRRQQGVMGGMAVIAGTRVPVIVILQLYQEGGMEAVRENYPEISDQETIAAVEYAQAHPEEIERDLFTAEHDVDER